MVYKVMVADGYNSTELTDYRDGCRKKCRKVIGNKLDMGILFTPIFEIPKFHKNSTAVSLMLDDI